MQWVNREVGERTFKSSENFQRYLALFTEMYQELPHKLPELADQPLEARAPIHKMRGASTHLGLELLAQACAEFENRLDADPSDPLLPGLTEAVTEALKETLEQIERFLEMEPGA